MAISDYSHHNEDAKHLWWQEEGQFASDPHDWDDDDFYPNVEDEDELT